MDFREQVAVWAVASLRIGRQGPSESATLCRNRATAPTENICCQKSVVAVTGDRCVLLNVCYAPIATKFRSAAK